MRERQPTTRRFWSGLLALGVTALALVGGLALREAVRADVVPYEDPVAGIAVQRPAGWVLDAEGDYVFRLRDPAALPFKTTLQVAVVTVGPDATGRNVLDALTLSRSAALSGYRVLGVSDPVDTPHGPAAEMRYAFVASDANPFLETAPVVALGVDMVYRKGDQAVIATYMAADDVFDAQYFRFEQFLTNLQF